MKARHSALKYVLKNYKWGYALTSEMIKAHAYQCWNNSELAKVEAKSVREFLTGADNLASAFGVTLKGIITGYKLWPELVEGMLHDLMKGVFEEITYKADYNREFAILQNLLWRERWPRISARSSKGINFSSMI